MKITTVVSDKKIYVIDTHINELQIFERTTHNGEKIKILIVKTESGSFSNYYSIWKKLHIDAEAIADNQKAKITYTIHTAKNGVMYKNFVKIEILND